MTPRSFLLFLCLLLVALRISAAPLLLDDSSRSGNGYLEWMDDPQGRLDSKSALMSTSWRPLPGALSAGFVPGVVWLRVQVQSNIGSPLQWMLTVSNPLLDEVTLYDVTDTTREVHAGEAVGRSNWLIDYRSAVFSLTLQPEKPHFLLLRLKSKNAMSVGVRFTPDTQFAKAISMEYLGYGLYFGIYLVLIAFHAAFWRMTHAPESGWYLTYVSFCVIVESLTLGLPQQLFSLSMEVSDTLLGCSLSLSFPVGVIFAIRQLQLRGHLHLQRALTAASLIIGATSASAVLLNRYQLGAPLHQISALMSIPFLIGFAMWLSFTGHRPARYFLILFGIYYAGISVSFIRNLGYLPATFITDNAVAIGSLLHMLLMSIRIIRHYQLLKEKARHTELAFKEMTKGLNAKLEKQITIRTRELSEEISRRTQLEEELRESLHFEKRIREEQRDFVAMVSHEFRTPLAIISTSAQQIIRNLEAPQVRNKQRSHNINEASRRLMALVDDYLNHDRIAECATEVKSARHNLEQLIRNCIDDFLPSRIQLNYRTKLVIFNFDFGLLQVALRNLLANADRHSPSNIPVLLDVEESEKGVQIRIYNGGKEIPADEAPLLFQKYYRGTQSQHMSGAGLGLYLVKRIAELHAGTLKLESRGQDKYICFCLELPSSPEKAATQLTMVKRH